MGVQMNIKNAEAVALAHEVAELRGISVTQAVLEALKANKRELTADDRKAKMDAFLAESRRLYRDEDRNIDHTAFLYDENGMPA
jgi:hypothetical protein